MIEKTFPITESLLSNGLKTSQQLLDLLNSESESLAQKTDPALLSLIASNKKAVVDQLELFSKQLGQILATERLAVGHDGVQLYLSKAQAAGMQTGYSRTCWANITAVSKKCRTINEQNGASIELLSRHTERAIQILKGKSQLTSTYGPDGSTRSELFSRTLVSV